MPFNNCYEKMTLAKRPLYAIQPISHLNILPFLENVMSNKRFAERLNKALDDIDAPEHTDERIEVLAKLVKIPKFKAQTLLEGVILPDATLLTLLASEFEVNPDWLLGQEDAV